MQLHLGITWMWYWNGWVRDDHGTTQLTSDYRESYSTRLGITQLQEAIQFG